MIAAFKREHGKTLDKRERRKSTVVLMSARRDVDGNVIGEEEAPNSDPLSRNNNNEEPDSLEQG